MGLTKTSTGMSAIDDFSKKFQKSDMTIALAGNPNVGKSTLFNNITGMHQHTGNWPGKTVAGAVGNRTYNGKKMTFVDLPGCYSLSSNSPEEEIARDFIKNENPDVTVLVCDATCLERNLFLVLQTLYVTNRVIVCGNLIDEGKKHNIKIDLDTRTIKMVTENEDENTGSFRNGSQWSGTGFALKSGYVVTNYHVIENAKSISISMSLSVISGVSKLTFTFLR